MSIIERVPSGITGGYNGSLAIKLLIAFSVGLAIYNAGELVVLVFLTFNRYRSVYFWSLLIASFGILCCALGFFLKFFNIGSVWLALSLIMGWVPMVTGQSIVLWSRLHLVVRGEQGEKTLKWTKWMIIIDALVLHIPTSVLMFGSNAAIPMFVRGYNVMEKIQMSGFFIQETILSTIYIYEAIRLLRTSLKPNARNLMYQLFVINFIIICLDLGLVGLECASLYVIQVTIKPMIYSIKLKLEFAVLSRLVMFVGANGSNMEGSSESHRNSFFVTEKRRGPRRGDCDITDFVDIERVADDVTHAVRLPKARTFPIEHISASDTDIVIFRVPAGPGVPFRDIDAHGPKAKLSQPHDENDCLPTNDYL